AAAAAHASAADRPGRPRLAGPRDGLSARRARRRAGGLRCGVDAARARGPAAAREAVLPTAARRSGPGALGRAPADRGRGRPAADRARLRRRARRAAPHRGADWRAVATGCTAAHAAPGDLVLPGRRPRSGWWPAGLPAGFRRPRLHAVVAAGAAGRGRRGWGPGVPARYGPLRRR